MAIMMMAFQASNNAQDGVVVNTIAAGEFSNVMTRKYSFHCMFLLILALLRPCTAIVTEVPTLLSESKKTRWSSAPS